MPAVPEPLGRRPQLRRRRGPLRHWGRRRQLQLRRLRPVRRGHGESDAEEPLRRSTGRCGRHDDAADRGGRCAPGAKPPPPEWPARAPERCGAAGRSGDRQRAADEPPGGKPGPQCGQNRRLRLPQPVPLHDPAALERVVDRRRRLGRLGGDRPTAQPDIGGTELRLALLRGCQPTAGIPERRSQSVLVALQRRDRDAAVLHLQPRLAHHRRRQLSDRQLGYHGPRLLHRREQLPGVLQQRALLRGLCPQLHLVHARRDEWAPRPDARAAVRIFGCRSRRPRGRPERRHLLCRSEQRDDPRDQVRRGRQHPADGGCDRVSYGRERAVDRELRRQRVI